jgi:hypothetical protein
MFAFACLFVTGETDFGHLAELREVVCDSYRGEGGKRRQKRERERETVGIGGITGEMSVETNLLFGSHRIHGVYVYVLTRELMSGISFL